MTRWCRHLTLLALCGLSTGSIAQVTVRAHVFLIKQTKERTNRTKPDAVIWLTPVPQPAEIWTAKVHPDTFRLEQKNKEFIPHILVVPTGSMIAFPNLDPFFHNVFSQFNGKRFDLGLYETGQSRAVRFNRTGVSYIFCNIHPEMSAVVITVNTPYYAMSSANGSIAIADVPPGDYEMQVWAEGVSESQLASFTRKVKVASSDVDLGNLSIREDADAAHKNKFDQDYLNLPNQTY
jgi:plastocyanin